MHKIHDLDFSILKQGVDEIKNTRKSLDCRSIFKASRLNPVDALRYE
jgi:hypothetical protein